MDTARTSVISVRTDADCHRRVEMLAKASGLSMSRTSELLLCRGESSLNDDKRHGNPPDLLNSDNIDTYTLAGYLQLLHRMMLAVDYFTPNGLCRKAQLKSLFQEFIDDIDMK